LESVSSVVKVVTGGPLAVMSGVPDTSEILGVDPGQQHSVISRQIPMATGNDSNVSQICDKWGYVAMRHGITSDSALAYNVDPMAVSIVTGAHALTPTAYAASFFRFWGGSLCYKVTLHSSPFIRGRIGVVIVPPGVATLATFPVDGALRTILVETCGSTEFEFEVPYEYSQPYQANAIRDIKVVATSRFRLQFFAVGSFAGSVGGVNPQLTIQVRGGKDFRLASPDLRNLGGFYAAEGAQEGPGAEANVMQFGENVTDLAQIAKRFSPMVIIQPNASGLPIFQIAADGVLPTPSLTPTIGSGLTANRLDWTPVTWLRAGFWGYTGGTRWKVSHFSILATSPQASDAWNRSAILGETDNGVNQRVVSYLLSDWTAGICQDAMRHSRYGEVELPDKNTSAFRVGKCALNGIIPFSKTGECLTVTLVNGELLTWAPMLYIAAADDFQVGGLITPVLFARA